MPTPDERGRPRQSRNPNYACDAYHCRQLRDPPQRLPGSIGGVDREYLPHEAGLSYRRTCVLCSLLSYLSLPPCLPAIFSLWLSFVRVRALLSDFLLLNRTFDFLVSSMFPRILHPNLCFSAFVFLYVAAGLCVCPVYNSVSQSVSLSLSVHVFAVICFSVCLNLSRIDSPSSTSCMYLYPSYVLHLLGKQYRMFNAHCYSIGIRHDIGTDLAKQEANWNDVWSPRVLALHALLHFCSFVGLHIV